MSIYGNYGSDEPNLARRPAFFEAHEAFLDDYVRVGTELRIVDLLGLGLTVPYSAVGVGVNSAVQCGWG